MVSFRLSTALLLSLGLVVAFTATVALSTPVVEDSLLDGALVDTEISGKTPPIPPILNPLTGSLLQRLIKRCIITLIKLIRSILHKMQSWVLHTTSYLELLEARQILGPFFNRVLHRVISWLRGFHSERECVGRALCELSVRASPHLYPSLKQVLLIYFSANPDASMYQYYQPLANGFISETDDSCARLYNRCNQQAFFGRMEHFNVTVPDFYEPNEITEVVTAFGKTFKGVPVVSESIETLPEVVPAVPAA